MVPTQDSSFFRYFVQITRLIRLSTVTQNLGHLASMYSYGYLYLCMYIDEARKNGLTLISEREKLPFTAAALAVGTQAK